jgi:hypothetical protein
MPAMSVVMRVLVILIYYRMKLSEKELARGYQKNIV